MRTMSEVLEKLKSICKEARMRYGREELDESKRLFFEAAKIAKEHNLNSDAVIFDASVLIIEEQFDDAISRLASMIDSKTLRLRGLAFDRMGLAYGEKEEHDKAIDCYEKALTDENYDTPGYAWNNMGNIYYDKKEYDKAIECYEKALAEESYDTPGMAWNNMGSAYYSKKEYDKAIECYKKALAEESYDTPGYAWYNTGLAYEKKKEYDKAIEHYENAKINPPYKDDPDEIAKLNSMISIIRHKIRDPDSSLSSYDEGFTESITAAMETAEAMESPESVIQLKIQKAGEDIATRYSKTSKSKYDNVFVVLKGWSSATPLFGSHEGQLINECRGGGYFIKWQGKGIVVDPGLDFIRNFDEAGFNFREIDAVIVSHNHTDHNQDLRPLDDIMFELRRRSDDKTYGEIKYYLITDEDTEKSVKFDPEEAAHRKFLLRFDIHRASREKINLQEEGTDIPVVVRYFKAKHEGAKNAIGVILDLYDKSMKNKLLSIGMSCDTEFFEDLCEEDKLGACDLLVAHISQPDSKELTDEKHFKKGHLGYRGTAKLIQNSGARLNLVSEFWGGKGDLRIELTQGLRQLCDDKMIFPGSIGCMVDLNSLKLQCTNCKNFISPGDIIIAPPISTLGRLQYLCSNCRV